MEPKLKMEQRLSKSFLSTWVQLRLCTVCGLVYLNHVDTLGGAGPRQSNTYLDGIVGWNWLQTQCVS